MPYDPRAVIATAIERLTFRAGDPDALPSDQAVSDAAHILALLGGEDGDEEEEEPPPAAYDLAGQPLRYDWDEDAHPRGQPDNAGQFASGGGEGDDPPELAELLDDEANLDGTAEQKSQSILGKIAGLPAHLVPQRVKDAAVRVKTWAVQKLKDRYGERAAGLIIKAAVLSAPIPLPGTQPATIVASLIIAEAVRAFRVLKGGTSSAPAA